MKINKLLIAAMAATTLFASCTKEGGTDNVTTGKGASLTVSIDTPDTKASVGTLPGNTLTVSNYFVVVANGDNIITSKYSATPDAMTLTGTDGVTTAASKVYVVANVSSPTPYTPAQLATVTTFLGVVKTELGNGLLASGEGDVTKVAADPTVLQTTVSIKPVKARITLTLKFQDENGADYTPQTSDELAIKQVAVLNAFGKSKLFGTTLYDFANAPLYNGITTAATTPFAPTVSETSLTDLAGAAPYTNKYVYYVCENSDITTKPTIVTVVAKWNGVYAYYPVQFTAADALKNITPAADQKILRGKSYNITMTLKGKWNTGGGGLPGGEGPGTGTGGGDLPGDGGTTDPTLPLTSASIAVTLTVADWTPVAIDKIFE